MVVLCPKKVWSEGEDGGSSEGGKPIHGSDRFVASALLPSSPSPLFLTAARAEPSPPSSANTIKVPSSSLPFPPPFPICPSLPPLLFLISPLATSDCQRGIGRHRPFHFSPPLFRCGRREKGGFAQIKGRRVQTSLPFLFGEKKSTLDSCLENAIICSMISLAGFQTRVRPAETSCGP